VVPTWSLGTIYKGMFDFMFIQVIAILVVFWFPQIALWLPTTLAEQVRAERMAPPSLEQEKEEEGMMKGGSLEEDYKGDGEEKKDPADKKGG
jgi:hypothetical protein